MYYVYFFWTVWFLVSCVFLLGFVSLRLIFLIVYCAFSVSSLYDVELTPRRSFVSWRAIIFWYCFKPLFCHCPTSSIPNVSKCIICVLCSNPVSFKCIMCVSFSKVLDFKFMIFVDILHCHELSSFHDCSPFLSIWLFHLFWPWTGRNSKTKKNHTVNHCRVHRQRESYFWGNLFFRMILPMIVRAPPTFKMILKWYLQLCQQTGLFQNDKPQRLQNDWKMVNYVFWGSTVSSSVRFL